MNAVLDDVISDLADTRRQQLIVLDQILFDGVARVPDVNRTDIEYYQQFFDADHWEAAKKICRDHNLNIVGELQRNKGRVKFQPMAGTASERAAAVKALDAAEKVLGKRGPKLQEQIHDSIAELNGLEAAARDAAAVVAGHNKGVELLRKYAPPHIREQHGQAIKKLNERRRSGEAISVEDEKEVERILDFYNV